MVLVAVNRARERVGLDTRALADPKPTQPIVTFVAVQAFAITAMARGKDECGTHSSSRDLLVLARENTFRRTTSKSRRNVRLLPKLPKRTRGCLETLEVPEQGSDGLRVRHPTPGPDQLRFCSGTVSALGRCLHPLRRKNRRYADAGIRSASRSNQASFGFLLPLQRLFERIPAIEPSISRE
jgi:hypothetical protein